VRLRAIVVLAAFFTVTAWNESSAQSLTFTAGVGRACHGSDGSVCSETTATAIGSVGVRLSPRTAIGLRVSRFENAFTGQTPYYDGLESVVVARLRHDIGRTMKYGGEILYYPSALSAGSLSAFIGGGVGVRTFRHRTTCASGACNEPGPYAMMLDAGRVRRGYVGFIAAVDASIALGIFVRGTVRLDDFPSEVGAAQIIAEFGYRLGTN
jgi:hypothetical protein